MQQHRFSALCRQTGLTRRLGTVFLCLTILLVPAVAQMENEKPEPLRLPPQEQQQRPLQEKRRRHVGTAAEAVVHVRVTLEDPATGKTHVRKGSGFVTRCDGFILVPTALFSRKSGTRRGESLEFEAPYRYHSNTLTFVPPMQAKTPPPQTVPRLHFFQENRGFVMAKVNGWHLPCLPMLAPRNIREGMPVRIVYAVLSDEKPQAEAKTATEDAVVGVPLSKDGRRFALSSPGSGKALSSVPPGAVVVDRASGFAIGIVPGTTTGSSDSDKEQPPARPFLLSFTDMYQTSNAVALLPDASAAVSPEAAPPPGTEKDGMLWIPGGTADMSALGETPRRDYDYTLLYNNRVVCMPGFWIDKRPVTNVQYQHFLAGTGYARLPRDWVPAERGMLLGREPEAPVTGVTTEDATAYAAWAGKRLVTPSEWVRACGGGFYDAWHAWWGAYGEARSTAYQALRLKYIQASPNVRSAWEQLYRRHSQRWRPSPSNPVAPKGADHLPKGQIAAAIQAEIQPVQRHFGYPRLLIPVGQRDFDISVFGVRDVKLNGAELLLPNTSRTATERAPKYANCIDPDHIPRWNEYDLLDPAKVIFSKGAIVGPDGQPIFSVGIDRSRMFPVQQWQVDLDMPSDANRGWLLAGDGFRCAR